MSLFNKMLFDSTKGAYGFDQTVKVPDSGQPTLLPTQENTPHTGGIMTVDTSNTLTPEEAAALAAFTGGSNSYAPPSEAYPSPTPAPNTGANQDVERNPNDTGAPPDTVSVPTGPAVPYEDVNPYPDPIDLGIPTGTTVGMSDPTTPHGGYINNGPFVNPYVVATDYGLKGLQPDRTGQNPFARPEPNTVSMQANETIMGGKNPLSQLYYTPQDLK